MIIAHWIKSFTLWEFVKAHWLTLTAGLAACAVGGPQGGYANYDALARMQQDCAAKGGTLKLKPEADPQWVDGYACERK